MLRARSARPGWREQMYLESSIFCSFGEQRRAPGPTVADHGVQHREELAHASDEGDLHELASVPEPLVGGGDDGGHVEDGADRSAASPARAAPALRAAVVVERCDADEGCDLLAV